ncbi:MAG: hypothetical protein IPM57_06495 [Oligoflexia bacterium]|nr:hypothetical protein [Oligoflexia bacterium]
MFFSLSFVITLGYSNCSQVKFSQLTSKSTGDEGIQSVCDPNLRPDDEEFQACPGDNAHQARRTRIVYCATNNTWAFDNWSAWNYGACVCPIANQVVNTATGLCECQPGFHLDTATNTCVDDNSGSCTGTPDTYQQDNNCLSGQGFRFRTRSVTCNNGTYEYTPAQWGANDPQWQYTSCQCANLGEQLNPLTGECNCPAGQVLVNGACVTQTTCGPDIINEHIVRRNCQVGHTYVTRDTLYTYISATNSCSTNITESVEQFDQCSCAISGQILNQTDLSCNCPADQQLINGSCQTPIVCDPNNEPGPWNETRACISFNGQGGFSANQFSSGNATRDRTRAQCVNGAWTPNPLGSWNSWNFGSCVCANQGETVNAATGACSCPPNYTVYNGQCRLSVCTQDTTRSETQSCSAAGTLLPASGSMTRTVPVQCINNGTGTQDGTPSAWNYSACSCTAYPGTIFNSALRACQCPNNGTWNGSGCTPACNLTGPTTAACGGGATSGQFSRVNACSAWSNNCACPTGQNYVVTDAATPTGQCQCSDPNLNLYNGQCLPRVCSYSGSQTEIQYTGANNCGYRTRDITCSNNGTSLVYGQWKNRAGTVIPTPNDRYDLSQCSCTSNQQHLPDIYSTCTCPSNTVWNGVSCVTPGTDCGAESSASACPSQAGANVIGQIVTTCQKQINSSGICAVTSNCTTSNGCTYYCANNANNYPDCNSCSNGATPVSNCTSCDAPKVMKNGSCQLCDANWGWAMPNLCAQCGNGYESGSDGYCHACTGNSVSNASTGMRCQACPAGTEANSTHSACVTTVVACETTIPNSVALCQVSQYCSNSGNYLGQSTSNIPANYNIGSGYNAGARILAPQPTFNFTNSIAVSWANTMYFICDSNGNWYKDPSTDGDCRITEYVPDEQNPAACAPPDPGGD